jgi:predicted HTH domain antitoxin
VSTNLQEEKQMSLSVKDLVDAKLYPNHKAVIQDALRSLLQERPQLRIELAVHSYRHQDISLAKAAHLARVSFDRMKEILLKRGIHLRLGPKDVRGAGNEVKTMERFLAGRKAP